MNRKLHFISGLPRSGSTLLSAILQQNPRFHAAMTSPVGSLVHAMQDEMSDKNEFSVFITDEQRKRIIKGVFDNYYGEEFGSKIIFDTNRLWCARLHQLKCLYPESKVIACVRSVPWILDSIEKLVRSNALRPSSIFNYKSSGTVYSRVDGLVSGDGMVGFAHNALKQAFYSNESGNLMILRYETLVENPAEAISAVYQFTGEKMYSHNFDNVSYEAEQFDLRSGTPGMHAVQGRVEKRSRVSVLPPDLFARFENESFWLNPKLNTRNVLVV